MDTQDWLLIAALIIVLILLSWEKLAGKIEGSCKSLLGWLKKSLGIK